jgi:predicted nucleic acid-binding protein
VTDPVIDTSVLVDYLRGHQKAIIWLDGLRASGGLHTHAVVAGELLIGARDRRELQQLDRFLANFTIIPANEADSLTAVDYVRHFHLSQGVGLLDCVIAATCVRLGRTVATANTKHFAIFPTISVFRPY